MRGKGKFVLASAGLIVAAVAALGLFAPTFATADDGAPGEEGIVIGLGEATPLPDGGTEFEVVRWVEDGVEVAPVPDVKVLTDAEE